MEMELDPSKAAVYYNDVFYVETEPKNEEGLLARKLEIHKGVIVWDSCAASRSERTRYIKDINLESNKVTVVTDDEVEGRDEIKITFRPITKELFEKNVKRWVGGDKSKLNFNSDEEVKDFYRKLD